MVFTKVKKMFSLVISAVLCLQVFAVDMCCHAARNNKVDVLYATDDGYFFPTLVSMQSAIDAMRETTFYNFHVMIDGNFSNTAKLNEFAAKNSDKCLIKIYDMKDKYKDCYGGRNNWPASMYYRLDAPDVLNNVSKCIYIDGDTLVMGDLCELFNTDLGGAYIGGVLDACITRHASPENLTECINSGVLLMDLESMRTKKINWYNDDNSELKPYTVSEVIKKFVDLNNKSHTFDLPDQDILNKIFYQTRPQDAVSRKKLLPLKYNFMNNLFTGNAYGTDVEAFDKIYIRTLRDSSISFGKHQHWPEYTNSEGVVLDFVCKSSENNIEDERGVKHFKFKNNAEILTHTRETYTDKNGNTCSIKTYRDKNGNTYNADFEHNFWKSNIEHDNNNYIIDACGDIHKVARVIDKNIYWTENGIEYCMKKSGNGFADGYCISDTSLRCWKDNDGQDKWMDANGFEHWEDNSNVEHLKDVDGNLFKLEDGFWVSENDSNKYLIDTDGNKYQITDASNYLFDCNEHYWTDKCGIRHKLTSGNCHSEQCQCPVNTRYDRHKKINTIPNFMDPPRHLIIEKIQKDYPVIVHFICDKPWKSRCNVENKGKNKEVWDNLHRKWHDTASKVTSEYGIKCETPIQTMYVKEYIEKPQNSIKQNFKDNLKWMLGGSMVGAALFGVGFAGVKKLFAEESNNLQNNKKAVNNEKTKKQSVAF